MGNKSEFNKNKKYELCLKENINGWGADPGRFDLDCPPYKIMEKEK